MCSYLASQLGWRKTCPTEWVTSSWWWALQDILLHIPWCKQKEHPFISAYVYKTAIALNAESIINPTCSWWTKPTLGLMQNRLSCTWLKASLPRNNIQHNQLQDKLKISAYAWPVHKYYYLYFTPNVSIR